MTSKPQDSTEPHSLSDPPDLQPDPGFTDATAVKNPGPNMQEDTNQDNDSDRLVLQVMEEPVVDEHVQQSSTLDPSHDKEAAIASKSVDAAPRNRIETSRRTKAQAAKNLVPVVVDKTKERDEFRQQLDEAFSKKKKAYIKRFVFCPYYDLCKIYMITWQWKAILNDESCASSHSCC